MLIIKKGVERGQSKGQHVAIAQQSSINKTSHNVYFTTLNKLDALSSRTTAVGESCHPAAIHIRKHSCVRMCFKINWTAHTSAAPSA